ncbi:MAG: FAD binding domain-containing protein [Phaeodactylibacter sp.]|nr:FAD binding domain-containing protein [Phaeodactylibacter sp.]
MIEFYLNSRKIRTGAPPGGALLDFIRRDQGLTGTKLVCKEGECAACVVLAGTLKNGRMHYQNMCSCIMPLANAHGRHIVTIEGLNGEALTPVQQAIVDCHGSQCGFCTPGFVVSLSGALLGGRRPDYTRLIRAIDGNICRCTGYKSIERAVERIADELPKEDYGLETLIREGYLPAYFRDMAERLAALADPADTGLPEEEPAGAAPLFLGGGTDLMVQAPGKVKDSPVLSVFRQAALKGVREENGRCIIGAATTATELEESEIFQSVLNPEDGFFHLLSSTPIRNMSTVGGNLINASPIGDFTILFLALDSRVRLQDGLEERALPLKEFYLGYKKLARRPEEFLAAIEFDLPKPGQFFSFEKVSARRNLDIASVNTAALLEADERNVLQTAHLSAGGVGPVPMYLHQTAALLRGKVLDEQLLKEALAALQEEISPISDARGSADYKRLLLRQLMLAHFHKAAPDRIDIMNFCGYKPSRS